MERKRTAHGATVLFFAVLLLICVACRGENRDSDDDGLSNAAEVLVYGTDPFNPDSDGDGILDGQETMVAVQFDNQILSADGGPCSPWSSNTVSVFLPGQNPNGIQLAPNTKSGTYQLSTGGTGAGIQVNFWYWCQEPDVPVGPADGDKPQNPDNSGGQFKLEADCSFTTQPAVYGKGIETYVIADVTSAMEDGVCVVTISSNEYTGCVTPNCCSPIPGTGQCPDITPRQYACPYPPPE